MKPTIVKRLVRQALSNNASNIKSFNTQRRLGEFRELDPLNLAIKDGTKLIKQLNGEVKKTTT